MSSWGQVGAAMTCAVIGLQLLAPFAMRSPMSVTERCHVSSHLGHEGASSGKLPHPRGQEGCLPSRPPTNDHANHRKEEPLGTLGHSGCLAVGAVMATSQIKT